MGCVPGGPGIATRRLKPPFISFVGLNRSAEALRTQRRTVGSSCAFGALGMTTLNNDGFSRERELGSPDALLNVERREHYGFVVNAGGVAVDGGGGLSAKVAIAGIEIERADVVRATGAAKLHAALDPRNCVMPLHNSECSLLRREG